MTRNDLVQFLRRYKLAVQSSISPDGGPQSAVIGVAVTDELEIVFDTLESTRKCQNLRANPRIALVIGWDDEQTAQVEGTADFPVGAELDRIREAYLRVFPDGHERLTWPGIMHVRVRPTWIRFSDFTKEPPHIVELSEDQLF